RGARGRRPVRTAVDRTVPPRAPGRRRPGDDHTAGPRGGRLDLDGACKARAFTGRRLNRGGPRGPLRVMQPPATPHRDQLQLHAADDLIRWVGCLSDTHGASSAALEAFNLRYPHTVSVHRIKAAIAPGSTTDPAWAGTLVPMLTADGFVPLAFGASLLR